MTEDLLLAEKQYLANLLEAIQRCVYFLSASDRKVAWPLDGPLLESRKKDDALFESLAAINERFSKLQDTLGVAMRHALILSGEPADSFLRVLAVYEKTGVIESVSGWQLCRTARNLSAHDYETQYPEIAAHFNTLHELQPLLFRAAGRFIRHCEETIQITPATGDFASDFEEVTRSLTP